MPIQNEYYYNPYQKQWQKLHPGKQFPTPQKYPHMFPPGAKTRHTTDYSIPLPFGDGKCNDYRICPRGVIDYRCQYQNQCYLNLVEFGFSIFGFLVVGIVLLGVLGKLMSFLYHFLTSAMMVTKLVSCITSCLQCLSFGMLEQDAVVQIETKIGTKKEQKHKEIVKKLAQIDLEINFQALDQFQIKKVAQILDDYQIKSQNRQSSDVIQKQ